MAYSLDSNSITKKKKKKIRNIKKEIYKVMEVVLTSSNVSFEEQNIITASLDKILKELS